MVGTRSSRRRADKEEIIGTNDVTTHFRRRSVHDSSQQISTDTPDISQVTIETGTLVPTSDSQTSNAQHPAVPSVIGTSDFQPETKSTSGGGEEQSSLNIAVESLPQKEKGNRNFDCGNSVDADYGIQSSCTDNPISELSPSTNHAVESAAALQNKSTRSFYHTSEITIEKESMSSERSGDQSGARDNFGWLIKTGQIITIDPLDTIPLVCVREVSKYGVSKLEHAFMRSEDGPGMSMGLSSAAPQPIVVRIPAERLHIVVEYFIRRKGLNDENANAIAASKIWYGVVEGAHRRKALINLISKKPESFKGYPWIVLCVVWQPLDTLRALARERNEFQRGEHLVPFTMYDIFRNLKHSAEDVALREGLPDGRTKNRGFLKRVADHYCGDANSANSLTRQLAGIAVSLSWRVIEEIGSILNTEDMEAAKAMEQESTEDRTACLDARVYRTLITRSTFRGATTFKNVASEEDQINTLRRLCSIAPQRNYKPLNKNDVEVQVRKAILARREVDKMGRKLQGHNWPEDLTTVKVALLTRTILDEKVEENKNSEDLLPEFREVWEKLFPIAAEHEVANKLSKTSLESHSDQTNAFVTVRDCARPDNVCSEIESDPLRDIEPVDDLNSADSTDKNLCTDDQGGEGETMVANENCQSEGNGTEKTHRCPLQELSVRVENKSWEDFQVTLRSEELFDFIVADPQQSLSAKQLKENEWTEFKDMKKIKSFANFCRISLRPGCYCFVFVIAEEFNSWVTAFHQEGMMVMKSPFLIIPKFSSVRVTRLKDLPQPCGDLAIVARAPGTCHGFKVNFRESYGYIDCSFTRKFGIIDNVPRCSHPLRAATSRTEIRPRERHPDLLSEIIETFCSPKGTVLDVCGGAMTTALSCISSRRPCVVIEKDKYCFELAVRRLEKLCRDLLLNPDERSPAIAETDYEHSD